jgi:hypothetical protein
MSDVYAIGPALAKLREAVESLRPHYTKADVGNIVAKFYGDSGEVVCPPASACPSQPSISSLPPDQKFYIAP